jgi:hypothetical protein
MYMFGPQDRALAQMRDRASSSSSHNLPLTTASSSFLQTPSPPFLRTRLSCPTCGQGGATTASPHILTVNLPSVLRPPPQTSMIGDVTETHRRCHPQNPNFNTVSLSPPPTLNRHSVRQRRPRRHLLTSSPTSATVTGELVASSSTKIRAPLTESEFQTTTLRRNLRFRTIARSPSHVTRPPEAQESFQRFNRMPKQQR